MSSQRSPPPTSIRCLMSPPAQLVGFEQPLEMVPQALRDFENRADFAPTRKGRPTALVHRASDLIQIPTHGRKLQHRLLERQILGLGYWCSSPQVGAHQERDVGCRRQSPSARALLEQPPILGSQTHVEARTAVHLVQRRRRREVRQGLGTKEDLEELLDER